MLTKNFLKNLHTKAQTLRPVVLIGAKGLSPTVHQEVEAALLAHELIKIRVNAITHEARQEMIDLIVAQHKATIVQQIGHVLVLYRPKPQKN